MRARLCAYLARCFNAHLTDDEKRFANDVAEARRLSDELNEVSTRLSKYPSHVTFWVSVRSGDYTYSAGDFRIRRVTAELTQRKQV